MIYHVHGRVYTRPCMVTRAHARESPKLNYARRGTPSPIAVQLVFPMGFAKGFIKGFDKEFSEGFD